MNNTFLGKCIDYQLYHYSCKVVDSHTLWGVCTLFWNSVLITALSMQRLLILTPCKQRGYTIFSISEINSMNLTKFWTNIGKLRLFGWRGGDRDSNPMLSMTNLNSEGPLGHFGTLIQRSKVKILHMKFLFWAGEDSRLNSDPLPHLSSIQQ